MLDQERVQRNPVDPGQRPAQLRLGRLGRGGPDGAETVRDPVDMGVDGDPGEAEPEDQDAVRGLRADAGERRERLQRLGDPAAGVGEQPAGALPDVPGLGPVEPDRPDPALDLPERRGGQGGGVRIPLEERPGGAVGVRIPGPLGEDGADQDLERVDGMVPEVRDAPIPGAVAPGQPLEDPLPVDGGRPGRPHGRSPPEAAGAASPRSVGSERSGSSAGPSPRDRRISPTR